MLASKQAGKLVGWKASRLEGGQASKLVAC